MAEGTEESSTIRVEVDAALKARWESSRAKITEAQRGGAESFVALWKSVAEVIEASPPLYLAAGFASAKAFVEKFIKVQFRAASRNIQVVRTASRAEIEQYGVTKLDAALGLVSEKNASFAKLRVTVQRKGKTSKVGLDEATVEEIRIAARALRPTRSAPRKGATATSLLLTKALADGKLKGVTARVSKAGITFRGLQVEQLPSLVGILSRFKLREDVPTLRRVA